jgi:hypothetical protein
MYYREMVSSGDFFYRNLWGEAEIPLYIAAASDLKSLSDISNCFPNPRDTNSTDWIGLWTLHVGFGADFCLGHRIQEPIILALL